MNTDNILLEKYIRNHPLAAAHAIEKLPDEQIAAFIESIPIDLSIGIIHHMHAYKVAKCLELIQPQLAVQVLERMPMDLAELSLRQSSEGFRSKMLASVTPKLATVLQQTLAYPEDSVGAFMIPIVLGLRGDLRVEEAIEIGKQEKERVSSQIYVVDVEGKLKGIVKAHDLLFAEGSSKLSSIMKSEIPTFFAETQIESVTDHPGWYEFQSIPVIDGSEKLIGALHFEATQRNERKTGKELRAELIETSNALGELYRIGLTGLLQSVSK